MRSRMKAIPRLTSMSCASVRRFASRTSLAQQQVVQFETGRGEVETNQETVNKLKKLKLKEFPSEKHRQAWLQETYLNNSSPQALEDLFNSWSTNKDSVPQSWASYFESVELDSEPYLLKSIPRTMPNMTSHEMNRDMNSLLSEDNLKVLQLIRSYRVFGHLAADLDPLGLWKRDFYPELDYKHYGFSEGDLDRIFYVGWEFRTKDGLMTLREILDRMKQAYCGKIGVEYMHIQNPAMKTFIREKIEGTVFNEFSKEKRIQILKWLTNANEFEHFLASTYKTAKRFGLEGCETLIPGLEALLLRGTELGLESVIFGMSHRGRLNVLVNILGKPMSQIFTEFADRQVQTSQFLGSGDVKYHLGTSADRILENGKPLHLSLAANPSHLEAVDPVVVGKTRAKQYYMKDHDRSKCMSIILHGDAAFSGQGVVAETLELSDLPDYTTGGTIHLIVNNQIGFTTVPKFSRSSPYPTDVAKGLQAPILHVNGDDPDAVIKTCEIAVEWRQKFKKDIVVDIFCYRRHGHNEMDQPLFTQPIMYNKIKSHPPTLNIYAEKLISKGIVTEQESSEMRNAVLRKCEEHYQESKGSIMSKSDWLEANWSTMRRPDVLANKKKSGLPVDVLRQIGKKINTLPSHMNIHRTIRKMYESRLDSLEKGKNIDWGTAEALAFGTLLNESYTVRLSGQDTERGTFSHRHAVIYDQVNEETFTPLKHVGPCPSMFQVSNSSLSEMALLGFEHGFSLENPNALVMWEAQFGDFANGAQVIIDQFISSGEQKWRRQSGLTMLLPHAYEGQGPEHSSARLERYLQLVSEPANFSIWKNAPEAQARMTQMQEVNLQVIFPSTPANFFHFLRRQIHREFRKPLVIMTPKSLLKASYCVSNIEDFDDSKFVMDVIGETETDLLVDDSKIKRVILCTGKVYYDLLQARRLNQITDIALVRIEQLAPFPFLNVRRNIERYPNADVVWCQEEPQNMGAWFYSSPRIDWSIADASGRSVTYAGRLAAASTATGSYKKHQNELDGFLRVALKCETRADWKSLLEL